MKKKFMFVDKNDELVNGYVEIESVNNTSRDYRTLETINVTKRVHINLPSNVKPATKLQEKLVEMANNRKFGYIFSGTEKQMDYLSGQYHTDFKEVLDAAKNINDCDEFTEWVMLKFGVSSNTFFEASEDLVRYDRMNFQEGLKKEGEKSYYTVKAFLILVSLYIDRGYTYGTDWLSQEVKQSDIDELLKVVSDVNDEYNNIYTDGEDSIDDTDVEDEYLNEYGDDFVLAGKALAVAFGHPLNKVLEHIGKTYSTTDACRYEYLGHTFFIGTDEQLEEYAISGLTDEPFLWKEAVQAGSTELGLREWAEEVVECDGAASVLNSYDGGQKEVCIDGTYIIIIPTDFSCDNFLID